MTFGPFGLLGRAAGIKTPLDREVGMDGALGGIAGSLLFDKNPNKKPDEGQRNSPYYKPQDAISTPGARSGRGSSSLSV